jgi:hypothetical protein
MVIRVVTEIMMATVIQAIRLNKACTPPKLRISTGYEDKAWSRFITSR